MFLSYLNLIPEQFGCNLIAVEMLAHKKYLLVSVTYNTMNQIGWWLVLRHELAVLTSGPSGEKSSPGCFVDGPALDRTMDQH